MRVATPQTLSFLSLLLFSCGEVVPVVDSGGGGAGGDEGSWELYLGGEITAWLDRVWHFKRAPSVSMWWPTVPSFFSNRSI